MVGAGPWPADERSAMDNTYPVQFSVDYLVLVTDRYPPLRLSP
jgi:hypothetical protein